MTAAKQSLVNTDRKTQQMFKVFDQEFDTGSSSSEDMDNYSPKSVVSNSSLVKVDVFKGRRSPSSVRNQIERIRAEDSHLGEDIGECFVARICGNDQQQQLDVFIFSRPASPLSGNLLSPRSNISH